jgi:hypothetical protein
MKRGATLITATEGWIDTDRRPTALLGGWPAAADNTGCGRRAGYGRSVVLFVGPQSLEPDKVQVDACTIGADAGDRRVIDRIMGTLRYDGLVKISGRFHATGGPAPGVDEPLSGPITLQPDDGGLAISLHAAGGRYSGAVPPGPYTITGTSPRIANGKALCAGADDPVLIRRRPVRANVVCDLN